MFILASLIPSLSSFDSGDAFSLLKTALMFAVSVFGAGALLRVFFGKQARVTRAVSASLSILLIYLASVLLYLFLPEHRSGLPTLPFITVDETRFVLWELSSVTQEVLYGSLLRLSILAFLVNLLETLLPQGERFFFWYLWRCLTALTGLVLYGLICGIITKYLPEMLTLWAKPVLLSFWVLILLSGILKVLLTIVLAAVNPIIGAVYAFFFSNLLGRQFTKSILTTLILVALVAVLNDLGFSRFAFADFSLLTYGPACLILISTLFLFGKFL